MRTVHPLSIRKSAGIIRRRHLIQCIPIITRKDFDRHADAA